MNRLSLFRLALMAVYLGLSTWVALLATIVRYDSLLLDSTTLSLVLFAVSIAAKRSSLFRASWVWLGANFISGQATLPGVNYLWAVCSVVIILVAVELSNFLEFLYPMRPGSRQVDDAEYQRVWLLMKMHARSVLLFAFSGGGLGMVGLSLISPVVFVYNPTLAVGVVLSLVLVMVVALSLEWRGTRRTRF